MGEEGLAGIVSRAARGEQGALDALVRTFEEPIRRSIRARLSGDLRRRVDTDDVFAGTIAAVARMLPAIEFRGEAAFLGWLDYVAAQQVVDVARHHRAGRRNVGRDERFPTDAPYASDGATPSQIAQQGESELNLRAAVARLPDDERRAVELRSWQGLTFQEVADQMNLPDRHAARRLYEAGLRRLGGLVGGA